MYFRFAILSSFTMLLACVGHSGGAGSTAFTLMGSDISNHDQSNGIVQVSPGIENTPTAGNEFVVPSTNSLFRVKLHDDPLPNAGTNGLLQIVIEYRHLASFLNSQNQPLPDSLVFDIDKIQAVKEQDPKASHREKWFSKHDDQTIFVTPTGRNAKVEFVRGKKYAIVLAGISLPAGDYESVSVHLKQDGIARIGTQEFRAHPAPDTIQVNQHFTIAVGRIAAINLVPHEEEKEREDHPEWHREGPADRRCRTRGFQYENMHRIVYPTHLDLRFAGVTQHDPVSKINVKMLQLKAGSTILNSTPTVVELLALRDGAVALMGHNIVPIGTFPSFDMTLGTGHTIVDENGEHPLEIDGGIATVITFDGPFELRGGRITEVILDFDPNTSVFYTKKGYELDPQITVSTSLSMTPIQEARLVEALGAQANLVEDEADLIFQGTVSQAVAQIAPVSSGNLIYTNVQLQVEDALRGTLPATNVFPLQMIGGTVNGLTLRVHGMPVFNNNERVILFLKTFNGRYSTVEGEMGKVNL